MKQQGRKTAAPKLLMTRGKQKGFPEAAVREAACKEALLEAGRPGHIWEPPELP